MRLKYRVGAQWPAVEAEVGHARTCVGGISLSEILESCILLLPGRTLTLPVAQKYTSLFLSLSLSQTHTHTEKEKTAVGLGRSQALGKRAEQVPDAINQTVGSRSKLGSKLQLQLHQRRALLSVLTASDAARRG